ncbi:MAG: DMT family transporter [Polyangiaceae bacterium]|nr:DMT family transporter [Polyangiaceae bacterium]
MIGEVAGLCAAACWAVGSLLFTRLGKRTSPEAMNLGKCLAAGSLLTITGALVGWGDAISTTALLWLLASAIAGLTIGDTAYFGALVRLGMAPGLLLLSSAPVFTALGGWLFLDEALTARDLAGILAVIAGVGLVVTAPSTGPSAEPEGRRRDRLLPGIALGVIAALGQASGTLLSKQAMVLGVTPVQAGGLRLLMGGAVLGVILAIRGRGPRVVGELEADRTWLRIAGAGMIGSYAGIWLAQIAISRAKTTGVAATLLATSPIFALPIARFAGETIGLRAVLGAVVGVGGVALLTLPA